MKKNFLVDTNIILEDIKYIEKLSNNKENTIYITETILKEIEKYKDGNETINFMAREFHRLLNESNIEFVEEGLKIENNKIRIIILKDTNINNINSNFYNNDDIIIETAKKIPNIIFITNDILFKIKCLTKGLKVESLTQNKFNPNISFIKEIEIKDQLKNKEIYTYEEFSEIINENVNEKLTYYILDFNGKKHYFLNSKKYLKLVDIDSNNRLYNVIKPKNLEQKLLIKLFLDNDIDIVVVDGIAGTGKTLLSFASAISLINKKFFNNIIYIRKTINSSNDNLDQLGFLPGNLEEKMFYYLFPLKDSIEYLIKKKKKNITKEELINKIKEFENRYNIEYFYPGHLRGKNLEGIIIIDETQNFTISDIILILSRIREGSKVLILGSSKQIDHPFLNRFNNALTFLLNQTGNYKNLAIRGIKLNIVERGQITDWIENITK